MADSPSTETLLEAVKLGESGAQSRLFAHVYAELRRLAQNRLSTDSDVTVSATGLVHEVYLRFAKHDTSWNDRHHFISAAAQAMRQIITDRARARLALKRGGGESPDALVSSLHAETNGFADDVLDVHEALSRLAERDTDLAHLVELRFFGGLEVDEVAELLEISSRTAARRWAQAKAQLRAELG